MDFHELTRQEQLDVVIDLHQQRDESRQRIKELEAERDGWREDANISRNSIVMLKDRCNHLEDTLTALRQRIADAPVVAWMGEYNINDIRDHYTVVMRHKTDFSGTPDRVRPLYTHPQPVEKCDHIPVATFGGDWCVLCNEPMESNDYPQPAIPAGWQLVPMEPTREMLDAFNRVTAWLETSEGTGYKVAAAFDLALGEPHYKAMLAAAPKPENSHE